MTLTEYKRKRSFSKTPEPKGSKAPARSAKRAAIDRPLFVIQKHDATRLHYDFRLQINGALASWAVPKGPSLDPADKRLAVHVEDHPIEYGDFEGVIPEGQYGAGPVLLWDRGWWEPKDKDPAAAVRKGSLKFTLHGEKLHGEWTLTRMHSRRDADDGKDNWLLIKHNDEFADPSKHIIDDLPASVKSGRTIEEVEHPSGAGIPPATKHRSGAGVPPANPSSLTNSRKSRMPPAISPELCTLTDAAPEGDNWIHEIKFDGYRLIAHKRASTIKLLTRQGKDWAAKFGPIVDAVSQIPAESLILDGEACILTPQGITSFQQLQQAIKTQRFASLVYFAFDLLYLDGHDLTRSPLLERKDLLRRILPGSTIIRYSEHIIGGGREMHANACNLNLEGIICKRADSPYAQARTKDWLKVKCSRRQEFIIIGYTPPSGSRKHFGSLLLAAHDGKGKLAYTGRVGTGFTTATLRDLAKRMQPLTRAACPADIPPTREESRDVTWIAPKLVAEVEFTEWTEDGRLRHPAYQGLREDKPAAEVRFERPKPLDTIAPEERDMPQPALKRTKKASKRTPAPAAARKAPARRTAPPTTPDDDAPIIEGITISSPDRIIFPDANLTKLDLARFYASIAPRILPYITARPLSIVRCPQGRTGSCFFQKHLRETFSDPVRAIEVTEKDGERADYIAIDDAAGLIALIQFGVIEIHPWGSRESNIDHPDVLTFDLDPGEDVKWPAVRNAAVYLRDVLDTIGLKSFVKVSGGKGLHVVVPLAPSADWDSAKAFCKAIADAMTAEDPKHFIATASKAKRAGKIFIDYLRNARGATSVAPWCVRARPGAPVAVPITWDQLADIKRPDQFTITTLPDHLKSHKADPWKGFLSTRQQLTEKRIAAVTSA